jgi:putative transposase
MVDKYQNKYRIPSARLSAWDYSSNAAYFLTVCTAKRQHYFGEIINGQMQLSDIGQQAHECWLDIPKHFQFVSLDAFIVMPNHTHGIIIIDKPGNGLVVGNMAVVETRHALSLQNNSKRSTEQKQQPQSNSRQQLQQTNQPHPRFRKPGKNTISSMIGSFKSSVTKYCNENKLPFGWQTRFHDHIIRDSDEFHRIKNYIINNPINWVEDKFFPI